MAQHVGMGYQPGTGGELGEGPAGVVGVDRRTPLGTEHQVELDHAGRPARLHPTQRHGGGLPQGVGARNSVVPLELRVRPRGHLAAMIGA